MRRTPVLRLVLTGLLGALFALGLVSGCSNQSEGERCGDSYGVSDNDDCGDGLVCTPSSQLLNGAANRCCYPGTRVTDSRCSRVGSTNATAAAGSDGASRAGGSALGEGGDGGEGAAAGTGGS